MHAPRFSIFTGDETSAINPSPPPPPTPSEATLRQIWTYYLLPELKQLGRAVDTLKEYRRHLGVFEAWCEKYRTSHPVLAQFDRKILVDFRGDLVARKFKSRNINKHLASVATILKCAHKHGLMASPPKLEPLPAKKAARKIYLRYDELDHLYRAFGKATWPQKSDESRSLPYSSGVYWRAALVLYFNYGFRTQELWSYESAMESLTWSSIHWQTLTPSEEGNAENEYGWLVYTPTKQRWAKDEPLVLPINQVCYEHLKSIEPPGGADPKRRIFPCPRSPDAFYDQWKRSVASAEIAPRRTAKSANQDSFLVSHLRKTCTTWHNHHSPGIAPLITGHADRGAESRSDTGSTVSNDHYCNGEMAVMKALLTMPQPTSFLELDRFDSRQTEFSFDGVAF